MKKTLSHIISWLLFYTYIAFVNKDYYPDQSTQFYLFKQGIQCLQIAIIFYLNYSLIVPRFLIGRRQSLYFWLAAIGLLGIDIIASLGSGLLLDVFWPGEPQFYKQIIDSSILGGLFIPVLFIGLSTGIRLTQQYYVDRYNKLELHERIKQAELDAIKSQINPHFLYNAFNSIYALAETKSDKTAEAILQLSTIMRYITYNASLSQVSIFEELNFIKTYVDFQKLRTANPDEKIISHISDPEKDFQISPLILITFIENAFKHSNLVRSIAPIRIHFEGQGNGFIYSVSNEIETSKVTNSGIGLSNLQRILDLTYPDSHQLKTWVENGIHYAELKISI